MEAIKLNDIPFTLISYDKNMGKGYALRRGVKAASAPLVMYTDIDFPFTDYSTHSLIGDLVNQQNDIVAGYRDEKYYLNKMSGFRRFLSKGFRFFIRSIIRLKITDTQCGLKGFNARGREIFLKTKTNRYLFDFEFIYLAGKNKAIKINPIPVRLKDNVVFRKMKLKILLQEAFNLLLILMFRSK
jgi:hypothetical protein